MRRILVAIISVMLGASLLLASPVSAAPPAAPDNVEAVLSAPDDIVVTWEAPLDTGGFDLLGYTVTIDPAAAPAVFVAAAEPLTASFETLPPGSYTAQVVATNIEPTTSTPGIADPVVVPGVPGAPTDVTATLITGDTEVSVSWVAPVDNGGDPVIDYTVTLSPTADAQTVVGTTAIFTSLPPGTTVTATVTARNSIGPSVASVPSNEVTTAVPAAAPDVPGAPSVVLQNGNEIAVSWTAPAENGSAISGYTVTLSNGDFADVVGAPPVTTATFSGITRPSSGITATVSATNGAGSSAASLPSAPVDVPAVVPSAPRFEAAVAPGSKTSVDVTWLWDPSSVDDPGDDVGGITGFRISVDDQDPIEVGVAVRQQAIVGLTPGVEYTFRVRALNSIGESAADPAAGISVTMPALEAPGAPQSVNATNDLDDLTVTWAPPLTGDPVVLYEISLSNGGPTIKVPGSTLSTTFDDLPAGSYIATVTAEGGAGVGGSASADPVVIPGVPSAVTGLTAVWAGVDNINAMNVGWTAPPDGGNSITGYVVTIDPPLASPIPMVDAEATSLSIGGLEQGTSYTVSMIAVNQIGDGPTTTSTPVLIPTTPGAVTNIVVEQSAPFAGSVVISWSLPTDTGGSPITAVIVSVAGQVITLPAATTTTDVAALPVGTHAATIQVTTVAGDGPVATTPSFEVKAFPPFDSKEDFVAQLYEDFLRRSPDPAGLAFWVGRTADDRSNVQDIVISFMNSPEFSPRRAVARLYFAYFNRRPEKGGFDYWTRLLVSRQGTLDSASNFFAQSPEFASTYGSLTDAEFIVLVYSNVLDRRPDLAGFQFWLRQMQGGMTRGRLMTLFSESPEFVINSRAAVDVTVTYDGMLQRSADDEGFIFWRNAIASDENSLATLVRAFFLSGEYASRVDS